MCGITGYVGANNGIPIVHQTLENLEYRGYDSAGVAVNDGDVVVYKQAGQVGDLTLPRTTTANCAIGHTRWSTHGEPTDDNAHPHTDCTGRIAVVHNGIIENYDELRAELRERHTFSSETDSEVVPHLLEEELTAGRSLRAAFERVLDQLEGSYAIAATARGHDGIVATRQDSPLVIGHSEDGQFLASDVPAFVEYTREVTYLEDGDIVHLTADEAQIFSEGRPIQRDRKTVEWDAQAAEKGGYEHFMLKEIHEQPHALRQTLSGRIDELGGDANLDISLPLTFLESIEEIQLVACGTSYHASLYAKELLEQYADVRVTATIASEYEFVGGRDPWSTLVVAITQSGETADTLQALRRATAAGARTMAVTNTIGSTVTRETDETLFIRAGPEVGVAATKTFASQVVTLALLSVWLGRRRGTLDSETASDLLSGLQRVPGAVQQVLDDDAKVRAIAQDWADSDAFFFIGRSLGCTVALEGALKLKEISYDHAEGFPAGELKHGPLALVTSETTVISVLTRGADIENTLKGVKEVDSRGASVLGITSDAEVEKYLDAMLTIPDAGMMEPVVANVYLQLFAYHVANSKGRAIDKPRNLAKSVTVE